MADPCDTVGPMPTPPIVDLDLPQNFLDAIANKVLSVDNSELTSGEVIDVTQVMDINEEGIFDVLMASVRNHLLDEYQKNRITGAEYAKAYIALTTAAMENATQFALGKNTAYWQGVAAQGQALQAKAAVEQAKVQIYATEVQSHLYIAQICNYHADTGIKKFQLSDMLPKQLDILKEQEKNEAAQNRDKFAPGGPDTGGILGSQRDLYRQQKISYQQDIRQKSALAFADFWMQLFALDPTGSMILSFTSALKPDKNVVNVMEALLNNPDGLNVGLVDTFNNPVTP